MNEPGETQHSEKNDKSTTVGGESEIQSVAPSGTSEKSNILPRIELQ